MAENGKFIGIDLAWQSDRNHTGAAVLTGFRQGAYLSAVSEPIRSLDGVRQFISDNAVSLTYIAIDAPLIIPNATGQRSCETLIGKRYGSREASCHSSNRQMFPNAAGVHLADDLATAGYVHAPIATPDEKMVMLEVYPHAALVALFDLPKVLKYKKGALNVKRLGLRILAEYIGRLSSSMPALLQNDQLRDLLSRDTAPLPGNELKMHEDRLDAVVCAYLAYYFWYWGVERNETFGDVSKGYITVPLLVQSGT